MKANLGVSLNLLQKVTAKRVESVPKYSLTPFSNMLLAKNVKRHLNPCVFVAHLVQEMETSGGEK